MVNLFEHQKIAIEKIRPGSILIGGVGSGKTLTSLVYFFEKIGKGTMGTKEGMYKPMQNPINLYVITTAQKRDFSDWVKEAANIPLKIHVVDSWNNIGKYINVKNSFFIFDEQHLVGSGVWVKSFLKIATNNQWILLTATPADSWMDLIPVFIANGFYKNRTEFLRRHVVFSRFSKFPKVERYLEVVRLIKLRDSIMVPMYFARKTIPHDIDVICSFDKNKLSTLIVDRWNFYDEMPIRDISELCFLMRKLVNSDESRIIELEKLFEKHKKVIVFYNFNYELDRIRQFAEENEISFGEWNGHKHEKIPEASEWLYLVQYMAGAEGWNCCETNAVVFYSNHYSFKIMTQAAGRTDRLDTPFIDLYYYHLTSHSIIDLAIKKSLKNKQNFNESRFMKI